MDDSMASFITLSVRQTIAFSVAMAIVETAIFTRERVKSVNVYTFKVNRLDSIK